MKDCENCTMNTICTYYDKEQKRANDKYPGWRWFKKCWLILTLFLLIAAGCTLVEYGEAKYFSLGGRSFDKLTITKDPNSITVEVINYEKKSPILVIEIPGAKIKSGGGQ